jgi:hypothetical protein
VQYRLRDHRGEPSDEDISQRVGHCQRDEPHHTTVLHRALTVYTPSPSLPRCSSSLPFVTFHPPQISHTKHILHHVVLPHHPTGDHLPLLPTDLIFLSTPYHTTVTVTTVIPYHTTPYHTISLHSVVVSTTHLLVDTAVRDYLSLSLSLLSLFSFPPYLPSFPSSSLTRVHLSGSAVHDPTCISLHARSLASHLLTASRSSYTDYSDTRLPQVYITSTSEDLIQHPHGISTALNWRTTTTSAFVGSTLDIVGVIHHRTS